MYFSVVFLVKWSLCNSVSSPVIGEFWQWVGTGVPGSIQVSSKEIASVGHEAEFWLWGGTLMTMVLYGVIGNIAGHVSHRVTL